MELSLTSQAAALGVIGIVFGVLGTAFCLMLARRMYGSPMDDFILFGLSAAGVYAVVTPGQAGVLFGLFKDLGFDVRLDRVLLVSLLLGLFCASLWYWTRQRRRT